ncbi:DUF1932 domain-containing protein [Microbacterium sp. 1P10UB]|uniref:DUF1932 domain-containing protein n=1 Tax=unclassified Microbacterium TaxID=2609290 RepID=UPI0039A33AB3
MRVAVLGLGEAGSVYAGDLAARGAMVAGVDPRVRPELPGVRQVPTIAEAVDGAEVVLSLVGGEASTTALDEALPSMGDGALYADLNTSHPDTKRALAARAAERGIPFSDIAILAPVGRARIETDLLVSGAATPRLLDVLRGVGIPAADAGPEPGAAAGRKLLRSVFMKGLAALVLESATAADAVGARDWVMGQIAAEFGDGGERFVERLLDGTRRHAVRREAEMRDVAAYLESLDAAHPMTDGTVQWLRTVAADPALPAR